MGCNSSVEPSTEVLLIGKTAIITGGNTGIGKETAKDFYKRGAKVIIACRNIKKAEQAKLDITNECRNSQNGGQIIIKQLNLNNLEQVRKCAENILITEKQINILVNNAGVMLPPNRYTDDGFETHFGVNHLGHFLFTFLLLPRIIESAPARIVNVSSKAHEMWGEELNFDDLNWKSRPFNFKKAYGQSKLANILFTKELARRLKENNIRNVTAYSLHPGVIASDLWRSMNPCFRFIGKYLMKNVEEGAKTTIFCSTDPRVENESGLYYSDCKQKRPAKWARDDDAARKLWEVSVEMAGLGSDFDPFKKDINKLITTTQYQKIE